MDEHFKNMFVIVGRKNFPDLRTLSYFKKDCIKHFLKDSTKTWVQAKRHGWRCIKVDVTVSGIAPVG